MPDSFPIPHASAEAWRAYRNSRGPHNPGLVFDRFAPDWSQDDKQKKNGLQKVLDIAAHTDPDLLAAWNARWEAGVRYCGAEPFSLQTDWRLIAGLGQKGPLEVGFTFHRYGFPYLPGSSLKGLARAWALLTLAEALGASSLNDLDKSLSQEKDKDFRKAPALPTPELEAQAVNFRLIFGTPSQAGKAIFFDAIPASPPRLNLEIMNPHYPDYYQEKKPPTNWQNPVPIYFLTVAPGVPFRFAVGWRGLPDAELQREARDFLLDGLIQLGAGGKTSAGYGYFTQVAAGAARPAGAMPAPRPAPPPGYLRGTVRDFGLGENKSYGFITPHGGGADIFIHQSGLASGLASLEPGQRVFFRTEINRRGQKQAVDVRLEE